MSATLAALQPAAARDGSAEQLTLSLVLPAEPPEWTRLAEVIDVNHAAYLHARWVVMLRERFYRDHRPDVADQHRYVVVDIPVPGGWRIAFGHERIGAFDCIGTLLSGHVAEGTVLVGFPLAALRAALDRFFNAHTAGVQRTTQRAS